MTPPINVWLLSQLVGSTTSDRIRMVAEKRGHSAEIVNPLRLHLLLGSGAKEELGLFDAAGLRNLPDIVLTRMGSAMPGAGLHTLQQLELAGVPCINTSASLINSRNKFLSLQLLQQSGIRVPRGALLAVDAEFEAIVSAIPGPPWVLKLPQGTKGTGVMKVDSLASLRSCVEALHSLNTVVLLQEFIPLDQICDTRLLVLGGRCVGAVRRTAKGDDFRSNIHRGGTAEKIEPAPDLTRLAERAASALGLGIAGVDVLEAVDGALVIEVNGSPGLKGMEGASGISYSDMVVDLLELTVQQK